MKKEKLCPEMELIEFLGCELKPTEEASKSDIVLRKNNGETEVVGLLDVTIDNGKKSYDINMKIGDFVLNNNRGEDCPNYTFSFVAVKPDKKENDFIDIDLSEDHSIEIRTNEGRIQFTARRNHIQFREDIDEIYTELFYIGEDSVNTNVPRYFFLQSFKSNVNFNRCSRMLNIINDPQVGVVKYKEKKMNEHSILTKRYFGTVDEHVVKDKDGKKELEQFLKCLRANYQVFDLLLGNGFFNSINISPYNEMLYGKKEKQKPSDEREINVANVENNIFSQIKLAKKGVSRLKRRSITGVAKGINSKTQTSDTTKQFDVLYDNNPAQLTVLNGDKVGIMLSKDGKRILSIAIANNELSYSFATSHKGKTIEMSANYINGDNFTYEAIVRNDACPSDEWRINGSATQIDQETVSVSIKDSILGVDATEEQKEILADRVACIEDSFGGFKRLKKEIRKIPFGEKLIATILSNYDLTVNGLDVFIKRRIQK